MAAEDIELTPVVASQLVTSSTACNDDDSSLPNTHGETTSIDQDTDRGPNAWRLLVAAFVFETLLWGFPLSFGVFQNYYSQIPEFAGNRYISTVGTIASGLGYLGAPFVMPLIQRHKQRRQQMILIGWPLCILGLVSGSFASSLEVLILTQGVAYGVGFLIFYYPIISMVNEYWIARRGMAYGILCGASGISGSTMPFILQALLSKYGFRITLRAVAVALTLLTGPLIPLLKGRHSLTPTSPTQQQHPPTQHFEWSFLRNPVFYIYSISNILQGFGYFFPSLYLPSYATSLGLSSKQGALLLALMSISQVGGQFTFGFLSDRRVVPLDVLAFLSTIMAAIACFAIWRLARSLALLILFAIVYGFFAAGFTAIWARISTSITTDDTTSSIVFGFLNFGKGIGNVLAGPIGAALLNTTPFSLEQGAGVAPAMAYRWIIIFTGTCMSASAFTICLRHLKKLEHWRPKSQ